MIGRQLATEIARYDYDVSPIKWALGDWLVYGEMCQVVGFQIDQAAEITGVSKRMLTQCKITSAYFPFRDRVDGPTWKMHTDTIPLPLSKALEILQKAVSGHWEEARWKAAVNLAKEVQAKAESLQIIREESQESPAVSIQERYEASHPPRKRTRRVLVAVRCPKCKHLIEKDELEKAKQYS